ncbi:MULTISPECIES: zinc-binding dehydrogenase [Acinetobacter]|uniref:zinc-binding dehydrogenase n=1 Tax=Acinetobacter TaxID=469 RepID=UPI001112A93D|nr:zinc-binding dehydrogenase [Acinetobacter bereziniae]MDV8158119.1 zinc-binding dehydrogenase [Acinetobacter bereziniae]
MGDPDIYKMISNLFKSVVRGEIEVPIDQVFPLEQASNAHKRAEIRGRLGRVIMVP